MPAAQAISSIRRLSQTQSVTPRVANNSHISADETRAVPTLRAMRPVQQREVSLPGLRVVRLFMVGSRLARPQQIEASSRAKGTNK